jgi:exonuclease SbcD
MRFFHLADLHIGKMVNGYSMIDDQRMVLQQVTDLLNTHRPDALILAGDIYDRRNPPVEAVQLFNDFISRVVLEAKVPVVAVGGNHDSGERLNFGADLLSQAGFYLAGSFTWPVQRLRLQDADGPVDLHLLPYADTALIHQVCQETQGMTYADAMAWVLSHIELQVPRNILVTHGMVAGDLPPQTSDSERALSVGGTESWPVELAAPFSYTALGHLHRPQRVSYDRVRYAGSLLAYSFSEEGQQKVMLDVTLAADGSLDVSSIPLTAPHPLRTVQGALEDLLDGGPHADYRQDYLQIILTDKGALVEPMQRLKQVFPRVMLLKRQSLNIADNMESTGISAGSGKDPMALFSDFYRLVRDQDPSQGQAEVMRGVFQDVERSHS